MKKRNSKEQVRLAVKKSKAAHSSDELKLLSQDVMDMLNLLPVFDNAKSVLLYCSMPDEVDTHAFLERYKDEKELLLPFVEGDDLLIKRYEGIDRMKKSSMGIYEPQGDVFTDYDRIDLVLVPGLAFDRKLARMGRGRGFYDRLLPGIKAPKIGLCFDFQLFDAIPFDAHDVKMDMVLAENELVWE